MSTQESIESVIGRQILPLVGDMLRHSEPQKVRDQDLMEVWNQHQAADDLLVRDSCDARIVGAMHRLGVDPTPYQSAIDSDTQRAFLLAFVTCVRRAAILNEREVKENIEVATGDSDSDGLIRRIVSQITDDLMLRLRGYPRPVHPARVNMKKRHDRVVG